MEWLYRRDWLEQIVSSQSFDFVVSPLIVLGLSSWLVTDFLGMRRAIKRSEPLRVWCLRKSVYLRDPQYFLFALRREFPGIILSGIVGLIILLLVSAGALAEDGGHWVPDAAIVSRIEHYAKSHMPIRNESDKTGPIGSYARYYTGITLHGRKTVYGEYISRELNESGYPVGVHIVAWNKMPVISDGGCYLIDLWFDVSSGRVTAFVCHGIA